MKSFTGADSGLVERGSANPFGAPIQCIYTFSEKLHEIKEILIRGRGGAEAPP